MMRVRRNKSKIELMKLNNKIPAPIVDKHHRKGGEYNWLWFFYLGIIVLILLSSCSVVNKALHKTKSTTDSTSVAKTDSVAVSKTDSVVVKDSVITKVITTEEKKEVTETEEEKTEIHYDTSGRKTKEIVIKKREKKVSEEGRDFLFEHSEISDSTSYSKDDSSSTKKQTATKVHKETKEVVKTKKKVSWNWLWLLLIIPAYIIYKKRKSIWHWVKNKIFPIVPPM
jgi:hypothetical protein